MTVRRRSIASAPSGPDVRQDALDGSAAFLSQTAVEVKLSGHTSSGCNGMSCQRYAVAALSMASSLLRRYVGCVEWIPKLTKDDFFRDTISGLIVGVMLLPQTLSYTAVLQFPQAVGLASGVVSGIAYSIFGSCAFLSVAAAAETTTFLLTALSGTTLAERVVQAQSLALVAGIIALGCSLLRGGSLLKILLSRCVGEGYSTAASFLVIVLQIKGALNLKGPSVSTLQDAVRMIINGLRDGSSIDTLYSALLFAAYVAYLMLGPRVPKIPQWFPHQLVVLIVATLVTKFGKLDERIGLAVQKSIPAALPTPSLPSLSLTTSDMPSVFVLALICFLQNYAVASAGSSGVDADREMWASGAVNLACGIFGTYPCAAGFGRSGILKSRNVKSPVTHIVVSCVLIVALAGLNRVNTFYYLPNNALAAILTVAMWRVIDFRVPLRLWRVNKFDLVSWLVTFFVTLFLGITAGILSGIAVSLLLVLVRVARPQTVELGFATHKGVYIEVNDDVESLLFPRVLLWRFNGPFLFVNVSFFEDRLIQALRSELRPVDVVVVNCSHVTDIDASALVQLPLAIRNIEEAEPAHRRRVLLAELPHAIEELLVREQVGCRILQSDMSSRAVDEQLVLEEARGKVILFRTLETAKEFSRTLVRSAVVEHDLAPDAARPAVAFTVDAITYLLRSRETLQSATQDRLVADLVELDDESRGAPSALSALAVQHAEDVDDEDPLMTKLLKHTHFDRERRELIGCCAVIRHAQRSPKQKLKVPLAFPSVQALLTVCGFSSCQEMSRSKFRIASGSEAATALLDVVRQHAAGGLISAAVASRLDSLVSSPRPSTTWQVKGDFGGHANESLSSPGVLDRPVPVTVVVKWGGQLTAEGRAQAQQHGRRFLPRFVACGDISFESMHTLRGTGGSVAVFSGREERLMDTAVEIGRSVTGVPAFDHSMVIVDDDLLSDLSCSAVATNAVIAAEDQLCRILHSRTVAETLRYRHLPGVAKLLTACSSVVCHSDPDNGLTLLDILWYAYELLERVAGGKDVVDLARRDGEAAVLPSRAGQAAALNDLVLYDLESSSDFLLRYAALAAEFLRNVELASAVAAGSGRSGADGEAQRDRLPFDTGTIPKIIDHCIHDVEHTVPLLEALTREHDCETPVYEWAVGTTSAIMELEELARALAAAVGPLSTGISSSERFISGALVCSKLLEELSRQTAEWTARDRCEGVRRTVERWLSSRSGADGEGAMWNELLVAALPSSGLAESSAAESSSSTTMRRVSLYISSNSHVMGLQHCLFENPVDAGFQCSEEYRHSRLGYMTHLVFKVIRIAVDGRHVSPESPIPFPNAVEQREAHMNHLLDHAKSQWDASFRYEIVPYLSTGMQLVAPTSGLTVPHSGANREPSPATGSSATTPPPPQRLRVKSGLASVLSAVRVHEGLSLDVFANLVREATETARLVCKC